MAQKDLLGYRQTVFCRPFEGAEWLMHHSIKEDNYMFLAMDENWTTILPQEVKKLDNGYLSIKFPTSISGYASVFRLTPLLNFQVEQVFNTNYFEFYHKYYIPYFIVQTWDSEGNLVLPKTVKKDSKKCTVEFNINFTGTICCVFIVDGIKDFSDELVWQYNHKKKISRGHILMQADDENKELMLPLEEKRFDENPSFSVDNYVQLEWASNQTGQLVSIIHGYRI